MRTLQNFIALLIGTFAGFAVMLHKWEHLAQRPDDLVYFLAWIGGTAALIYGATSILLQAGTVRLRRGPGFVAWVRPSACTSFSAWLSADWRFFGRGGQQRGTRIIGLEIAFEGTLS